MWVGGPVGIDAETVRVGGKVLESNRFNAPLFFPDPLPAPAPARRPPTHPASHICHLYHVLTIRFHA